MQGWIAGIALAVTLASSAPARPAVLELIAVPAERLLFCAELADGEEFVLSFIHSVNRRPVYDTFRVRDGELVIVKSRFDAFGAGMPETSTEAGTLEVGPDGWLEWTVNQVVPDVVVRVGWVARHTLHVRNRAIALAELTEPGTAVALRVTRVPPDDSQKGRCAR